jgi:hypothetical protein
MAVTVTNQRNPLASTIVNDTAAVNTLVANVTGAAGTIYLIELDNSANGNAVYVKFANATSGTIGSLGADIVLVCPASASRTFVMPQGLTFNTGISYWVVNAKAEATTAGAVNPMIVRLVVG